MIELSKTSGLISAPVDIVFKYVTNMENYGFWFPGVQAIKSKNNFPHATIGKTYLETLLFPDGEHQLTITVAQCEVNQLFLTKGDLEGVLPQMTIKFHAPEKNQCRIDLHYHSRNSSLNEQSEIIISLREDLSMRAMTGITNLQKMLENK